jgi:exosortase D (VPLPA-CTERM-specific)
MATPIDSPYLKTGAAPIWAATAIVLVAFVALLVAGWDGVVNTVSRWRTPEYSYGYYIPPLIAFFIWQRKHQLAAETFVGSWAGAALVLFAALLIVVGEIATLNMFMQYGIAMGVMGIALSLLGWRAFRWVMVPLLLLFFTVPLSGVIYNGLSQSLQLISSAIGVAIVRLFGISVLLEGNVIHLPTMQLQVVEACSGLRYLFPLMVIGFIVAYVYRAPFWKRALLFLSSVPITVLMNSFRIGLIGVTVEFWGEDMAQGILHDFEGWVVFMASLVVLLLFMVVLNRIGRHRPAFHEAFNIDFPGPLPEGTRFHLPHVPAPLIAALVVLLATAAVSLALPNRAEVIPERTGFKHFPVTLGEWEGTPDHLEPDILRILRADDTLVIDYTHPSGFVGQLYAAYYGSQRRGTSTHSPRECIPGGGWELGRLVRHRIEGGYVNGQPLYVNRTVVHRGDARQLVYYWFPQRGNLLTNEYIVKWYLFRDAVFRNRTDGALVRLTTPVRPGEDIAIADAQLADLARHVAARLGPFVPD